MSNEQDKGHGPPAWATVRQLRMKPMGVHNATAELIDNSVGNNAQNIRVVYEKSRFIVQDDGVGCTMKKMKALVSLGGHEEDERAVNLVSRYGVGADEAFIWAGGITEVLSMRDGEPLYNEIDWDAFDVEWDYPRIAKGEDARAELQRYSKFNLEQGLLIVQQWNRRVDNFEKLHARLSQTFWAAVETGVKIEVFYKTPGPGKPRGGPLKGKQMPEFMEGKQLAKSLTLSNGKQIRIEGGVLDEHARITEPGFEYLYGHRVLIPAGDQGAGEYGIERFYARVYLEGDKHDWQVETNKGGLHDEDLGVVKEAVFNACEDLLKEAQQQQEQLESIEDQELADELSDLLTEATGGRKARRKKQKNGKHGTVEPTGKGGKHLKAKRTQDDEDGRMSGQKRRRTGFIKVRFAEFAEREQHLLGIAKVGERVVRLNQLHPALMELHPPDGPTPIENKPLLLAYAHALWVDEFTRVDEHGQQKLRDDTAFVEKFSEQLAIKYSRTN